MRFYIIKYTVGDKDCGAANYPSFQLPSENDPSTPDKIKGFFWSTVKPGCGVSINAAFKRLEYILMNAQHSKCCLFTVEEV